MVIGFMVEDWVTVLDELQVKAPQSKAELLLMLLWDELCESMWAMRDAINNSKDSHVEVNEMATMADRLAWYLRHHEEVLDYRHRYLCRYTTKDITSWSRATRRAKLEMLNNARDYYATECQQRAVSQSTIYNWLHSYMELRSGWLLGVGLRSALSAQQKSTTQYIPIPTGYDSDSSGEFEFEWEPENIQQRQTSTK